MMIKKMIYMVLFIIFFVGCTNSQPKKEPTIVHLYTECSEPRPEICTREYKPVCATKDTGIRCVTTPCPATELKTYGNACTACSDPKVLGYQLGACKASQQ